MNESDELVGLMHEVCRSFAAFGGTATPGPRQAAALGHLRLWIEQRIAERDAARAEVAKLRLEIVGREKAAAITAAGYESTCERYDALKHENRKLTERVSMLREALTPYGKFVPADANADCRRAGEALAATAPRELA